jgi:hypothetical protein
MSDPPPPVFIGFNCAVVLLQTGVRPVHVARGLVDDFGITLPEAEATVAAALEALAA